MNQSLPPKKCFKSVLYISFVILFFQGIVNTELGIVSQFTTQNGQRWVGPLSTSLLFFGSGIGSLYNNYIGKMKYRFSFFLGSLGYSLFIGLAVVFLKMEFTKTVEVFILVGSFVSGIIVSMFYNSQFNYINTCSEIDNEETKYFGLSMCITQSANIFGNVVSALLIEPVGQINYAIIMNISIFVISMMFFGVKNQNYQQLRLTQEGEIKKSIQQQSNGQYINFNDSQSDPQPFFDTIPPQPVKQQIPYRIFFAFCFSGIIISFIFCELSLVYYETFLNDYEKEELNRITFVALIIEGIGEFLGGFSVVFGQEMINNKIGIEKTFIIISGLFLLALGTIYIGSDLKSLVIMDFGSFVAGYCDCMIFTLGLTIAGRWRAKGMTLFNIGQSGTVAVCGVMIALVDFKYMVGLSVVMFVLSTYAVMTYHKVHTKHKQIQHGANDE